MSNRKKIFAVTALLILHFYPLFSQAIMPGVNGLSTDCDTLTIRDFTSMISKLIPLFDSNIEIDSLETRKVIKAYNTWQWAYFHVDDPESELFTAFTRAFNKKYFSEKYQLSWGLGWGDKSGVYSKKFEMPVGSAYAVWKSIYFVKLPDGVLVTNIRNEQEHSGSVSCFVSQKVLTYFHMTSKSQYRRLSFF